MLVFNSYFTLQSLLLLAAIFFAGCSAEKKSTPEQIPVARVGADVITVDEFRRSYETAFGELKKGATSQERKRNYLDYMIKERLLALEGYRRGLDKTARVRAAEADLLNELLIGELIEREIASGIQVRMDEIREEINKSKVTFKFRYWVENSEARAREVAAAMREKGYADVVAELIRRNPERRIDPKTLESDYLNYQQVPPELLEAIKDLPYGDISDPVALFGKYFVFQVLDIRRSAVTENEYLAKAAQFEQIIYYRKLQAAVKNYVADLMQDRQVVTKAKAFRLLARAVQEWREMGRGRPAFRDALRQADAQRPALQALREHLNDPFFQHREGTVSVGEFLEYFQAARVSPTLSDANDFREALHRGVKNSIRDYFLIHRARAKGYENAPAVQAELKTWRDKWVFQETREELTRNVAVNDQEVLDYFADFHQRYILNKEEGPVVDLESPVVKQDALRQKMLRQIDSTAAALAARYPVEVYEAVLDTITVIDFAKSRWAHLQLFRGGTNRLVVPALDPIWQVAP